MSGVNTASASPAVDPRGTDENQLHVSVGCAASTKKGKNRVAGWEYHVKSNSP